MLAFFVNIFLYPNIYYRAKKNTHVVLCNVRIFLFSKKFKKFQKNY